MQSYVQGHKAKVEALINIYKAANRLTALEREKTANGWLKAATLMNLARCGAGGDQRCHPNG